MSTESHKAAGSGWAWLAPKVAAGTVAVVPAQTSDQVVHRTAYRPDIDGLRAIAVLSVVAYHAGLGVAPGGYVGVDIFFVISGYVISTSLLSDLDRRRFSITGFYERRVRRIFPALFVTLAATWCVAAAMFLPSYLEDYGKSLAASALFGSNLYFWKTSGYFANGAALRPLLHTWSLSVEEQFYIFAPLTLAFIHRFLARRWLLALAPLAAVSLALSILASHIGPTANFFLLPMRAWELVLGAMLSLRAPPPLPRAWMRQTFATAGAAMMLGPVFLYTDATPFPGVTALPPCLGAAMLIYVGAGAGPATAATRILARPPMVAIGLISYSLYLVHWPIVSFYTYASLRAPGPAAGVAIVAASLGLAYLSWRFVERPFRSPVFRPPRAALLGAGLAAMAAAAALGGVAMATHGFAQRYPEAASADEPSAFGPRGPCFLDHDPDPRDWRLATCTLTHGGPPALLWGDSYAAHYAAGIEAYADRIPYSIIEYTAAGCPPVLAYSAFNRPGCQTFNSRALEIIRRDRIRTVVLSARWVDLQRRGLEELTGTLQALRASGVSVYVIGQSPMFTIDAHVIAARRGWTGGDAWPVSFKPDLNRRLAAIVGPGFVDPMSQWCAGATCLYRDGRTLLIADEGHFTAAGSRKAVGAYFPLLQPSARPASGQMAARRAG